MGRLGLAASLFVLAACDRTTVRSPHEVNGQVFYTEHTAPSVGESLVNGALRGCAGGDRDDERALAKVPSRTGCRRADFVLDYTVDGVYRVDACGETYRVRCRKETTVSGSSTDCGTSCVVEDHFVPMR